MAPPPPPPPLPGPRPTGESKTSAPPPPLLSGAKVLPSATASMPPPSIITSQSMNAGAGTAAQHETVAGEVGNFDSAGVEPKMSHPIYPQELPPSPVRTSQASSDSLPSPEAISDVANTGKAGKDPLGKLNRFFQTKKPKSGRLLKGLKRGDIGSDDVLSVASNEPSQPAESEEMRLKRETHAAQVVEYEEQLEEWNKDYKRHELTCELHRIPFDPADVRPKPTPPPPLEESAVESVERTTESTDVPGLANAKPQTGAQGQNASELAEMFAAKAYGGGLHPAAAPGHTTSLASSAIFGPGTGPMIPPRVSAATPSIRTPPPSLPPPSPAAMYQPPPPPALAPHATATPSMHAPQAYNVAAGATGYSQPRAFPMSQGSTYVDAQVSDRIRRGRELTKLGIREEEVGNMGSAKEAYMKALELLIPAIPMLDHGNDVSYKFRMAEKQKLKRESALMLDRCEEIKKFLDSEVAALNTRNLLEQAPVPALQPKKLSLLRQEAMNNADSAAGDENFGAYGGGLGLAHRPVVKKLEKTEILTPPPPPLPPAGLLDGLASLSLSDHPGPAPIPSALSRHQLSGNAGGLQDPPAARQRMLSRPPDFVEPLSPAYAVSTTPTAQQHADMAVKCGVCSLTAATFYCSKCAKNYCSSCMNKAASFQMCLFSGCNELLTPDDFKHIIIQ